MKLHREGNTLLITLFLLSLSLAGIIHFFVPIPLFVKLILYAGLAVFLVFVLRFFRYTIREFNPEGKAILCPADGKVVVIEEVEQAEFFGDRRIQLSIFMSPYDIHVNWIPIDGKVIHRKYYPGRYLVAWHPKSSLENERTSVVISDEQDQAVLVRQIAGAVARRVVCYPYENDNVAMGDELGFIKFGSRVDLLLPPDARINVKLNDKVRGRETILANLS